MYLIMKEIYRYPSKEEREFSHFQTFLSLFKEFEIDNWERKKPPCPDFVFLKNNSAIGLELTTIMHESSKNISLMAFRNAQHKCFLKARLMANDNKITPLIVKAKFLSSSRIINIPEATEELYKFVVSKIPEIPSNNYLDIKPKMLKYFNWIRIRHSEDHDWCELKIVVGKINPIEEISKAIKKKQKKIKKYLDCCDICWLLIGIDEFNAPEAFKVTENFNHIFYCDFERVFFLHNIRDKFVELKIDKI